MRHFELFIDESGNVNPVDKLSQTYVLCGCAIAQEQRLNLKIRADQIKFKYWGQTNVLFHSRDIGKKLGDFAKFRHHRKDYQNFLGDLFCFLKEASYTIFVIVCDKNKAGEKGWNSLKVIKETAHRLFYHYIVWLLGLKNDRGKITIESATAEKDRYYLNEFSYFLSPGCKELSVDYQKVRSVLTSVAFVTKHNSDIEEQIADLFAYAAQCKYFRETKQKTYKVGSYEDRIIRILDGRLFKRPRFAKKEKMKFYEAIEPFCLIPK